MIPIILAKRKIILELEDKPTVVMALFIVIVDIVVAVTPVIVVDFVSINSLLDVCDLTVIKSGEDTVGGNTIPLILKDREVLIEEVDKSYT